MMPADLAELLNSGLHDGWQVKHISFLDPDWQALLVDDENRIARGTGGSIEEAIASAFDNALCGNHCGKLWDGLTQISEPVTDLATLLPTKKAEPILRRL